MNPLPFRLCRLFAPLCAAFPLPAEDSLTQAVKAIRAVSAEGKGNTAAAAAWPKLTAADAAALPEILSGMDGANVLAKNWLQSAVLAVGDQTLAAGKKLPEQELLAFLKDKKHDVLGRRLAYELLVKADPTTPERLLPGMLQDPSPPLRRDAVQRVMDLAAGALKDGKKEDAKKLYTDALAGAREEDQVKAIAEKLKDLGDKPDLIKHFGFLTDWKVIGPFHNNGRAGFAEVFPPEKNLDFTARHPGKDTEAAWKEVKVTDEFGVLNFNREIATLKEATAYAATEFNAAAAGPAEIRIGCNNAWKVWLNGEFIFGRDEYHRGFRIDQYKVPVTLRQGKNTILVKCCQNEEKETWTQEWHFQLRLSDEFGTALPQAK